MRTYAVCGLSNRAIGHFVLPLIGNPKLPEYGDFTQYGKMVAVLDIDRERVERFNANQGLSLPFYLPNEFDRMISETSPDVVVTTSPDYTHAGYIISALKHGKDVITEKPMVISIEQAQAVLAAQRKSKGKLRVAHNYRYTPPNKAIKRMVQSGMLGRVTSVEFAFNMDTYHGASYFLRWNRDRKKSGGLSIHKCCHHFDLVNWWLGDVPEQVFAYGALNYYGPKSPFKPAGTRSLADTKARCPYHKRWYARELAAPQDDHLRAHEAAFKLPMSVQYPPDKPLFWYDKDIAIEDTYSAVVRYKGGASMSYSCYFSAPWEGYTLAINGTGGRLETIHYTAPSRCPFPASERQPITYYPLFGERQIIETRHADGGHGGADDVMKWDMFVGPSEESKELDICAGVESGACAIAVGELVWRSIKENRPLNVPAFRLK